MDSGILIYDPDCSFCVNLAKRLKKNYGVGILPNNHSELPNFVDKDLVRRDVHFIRKRRQMTAVYTGVEAAVEIISQKHPFVAKLYFLPIIKQSAKALYFVVKKSRRYL